ncbi:helix-turn-helix domain-containing protein [Bradyrhizobium sp. 521_C7_N1_3]|uniref:helix-turn-helix domain-containing protein n=1 Tax=Bradyrhizobium TaxID=374 RepID=UPI002714E6B8|nr:helix-turn-helix domain-containing protein [Bradyrhizobium japonicum]WLB54844.1 helix-turn-helix domain-containing protein [Bradyrhizobium japonicum]WLB63281.1 helix-turn-helix domain-containing protein [Bradyrhizobium japonicum]
MDSRDDFLGTQNLDYEGWRDTVRSICGRYTPSGIEPKSFFGRARARSVCGFRSVDLSFNAQIDRTLQDVRADAVDHYCALFQINGQSRIIQNDRIVEVTAGDIALVDVARPLTCASEKGSDQWWRSLQLPRRSLPAHLGSEPRCPSRCSGAAAARPLRQLLQDAVEDEQSMSVSAKAYMRLAFYDLLGALFALSGPENASVHTDRIFARVRDIIKDHFSNPDFGPCEAAAEAGISLRYLQKLFTVRKSTCSHFINSVRLDHAARLLERRSFLKTGQPISEIAYASGFGDYTYFSRKFRRRFGHTPGSHCEDYTEPWAFPQR